MNILITGIGGLTPRSIAKSLKNNSNFESANIIGTDCNNKSLSLYSNKYANKTYKIPPISSDDYWDSIMKISNENNIDLAIVQPEVEIIGWGNYLKDNNLPFPVLIPTPKLAKSLHDKSKMSKIMKSTKFIPKTLKINSNDEINYKKIEEKIGYPCWIRATKGSGGFGSLKIDSRERLKSWLFINNDINEFTISEYLPGRHLATQMLYYDGEFIKGALLECAEYVMADIAPSGVTGNTSFGRLLNDDEIIKFSDEAIKYVCESLGEKANGVLSVDLKEDKNGNPKITEVNIRHMAYTGCLAEVGFNLSEDMVNLTLGYKEKINQKGIFKFDKNYIFLRDVDSEPIIMEERGLL